MEDETPEPNSDAPEMPVSPEQAAPDTAPKNRLSLGDVTPITADELIEDDDDAPVADNKFKPSPLEDTPAGSAPSGETPNVDPPPSIGKKRGRKPMTPEEKAQAKQIRDAIKAGKPPPDFSSLNKGGSTSGSTPKAPRDYYQEALSIFIPVSMGLGKFLGPHWSVPIVDKEINGLQSKAIELTEEQKLYTAQMARWMEYEQFPEVNPRYAFAIATAGYSIPKLKQDPTPEKLAGIWEWIRVKVLRREPKTQK